MTVKYLIRVLLIPVVLGKILKIPVVQNGNSKFMYLIYSLVGLLITLLIYPRVRQPPIRKMFFGCSMSRRLFNPEMMEQCGRSSCGIWVRFLPSVKAVDGLLTYNDILDLIMVNKIQTGDIDDLVEEMTDERESEFEEVVCEGCECCCCECDGKKQWNPSDTNSMKFLCAGYTDCMDEAIRFLVEEEKISPEHPVVRNLRAHLEHSKERILDAASEVISRPNAEEEWTHYPRTEHANAVPGGFLGELLRAWNTG